MNRHERKAAKKLAKTLAAALHKARPGVCVVHVVHEQCCPRINAQRPGPCECQTDTYIDGRRVEVGEV